MARRVCIIGGGVIGLASAYACVRAGMEVTLVEAQKSWAMPAASRTVANCRIAMSHPLPMPACRCRHSVCCYGRSRPETQTPAGPIAMALACVLPGACRTSVNRTNSAHLLRLASMSQDVLNRWRVEDHLEGSTGNAMENC